MPESASLYFLKYAFPCAYVLCDRGRMSAEDYDFLQKAAVEGRDVPFEKLEVLFPEAFRRMREVAAQFGLQQHSLAVIKKYFREEHNKYIDAGDGAYAMAPETFREFCKVKECPVLEKKVVDGKLFLRVEKGKWVQAPFFAPVDISVGSVVTVHHALAVEKVQ